MIIMKNPTNKFLWIAGTLGCLFLGEFILDAILKFVRHIPFGIGSILNILFNLIALAAFFIIPIASFKLWKGLKYQCPICKKLGTLTFVRREIVSKNTVNVPLDLNMRNRQGDITGSYQQYVPGFRTTYREWYICKHCNKESSCSYSKDSANT